MEEIFKGLVERAQYFESFRNTAISGKIGEISGMNLRMKVSVPNM